MNYIILAIAILIIIVIVIIAIVFSTGDKEDDAGAGSKSEIDVGGTTGLIDKSAAQDADVIVLTDDLHAESDVAAIEDAIQTAEASKDTAQTATASDDMVPSSDTLQPIEDESSVTPVVAQDVTPVTQGAVQIGNVVIESDSDSHSNDIDAGVVAPPLPAPSIDPNEAMLQAFRATPGGTGALADYIFIQGADQWGEDLTRPAGFTEATPPATIAQRCNSTGGCMAFNHQGYLKHSAHLNALSRYPNSYSDQDWRTNPSAGLYVRADEARRQFDASHV